MFRKKRCHEMLLQALLAKGSYHRPGDPCEPQADNEILVYFVQYAAV